MQRSSFLKANIVGIVVLVGLLSFIVGNRWSSIIDSVGDKVSSSESVNEELPADLNYEEVEDLYDLLRKKFDGDLSEEDLIDGLKSGLTKATGDVYTTYFTEEEATEFNNDLNGSFSGIGAELGKNDSDQLIIVSPIDGFPAQKAGVQAQDIIVEVDGEQSHDWSIEEAVRNIRGPKGEEVKLTLSRKGVRVEISIVRDNIVIPSVTSEILEGDIGYIKLSRFAEDTSKLTAEAAAEFKEAGVKKVILDLRNNGGGYLNAAVDVTGLWVPNQVIVEQREGDVVTESLKSRGDAPLQGLETVVLINGGSASASEIVAGAMQDLGVATLVGEKSFGKGSVQALEQLNDGGMLKVTIARWYTPNGRNISKEGIEPDVVHELTENDIKEMKDSQKDKAIEILNN